MGSEKMIVQSVLYRSTEYFLKSSFSGVCGYRGSLRHAIDIYTLKSPWFSWDIQSTNRAPISTINFSLAIRISKIDDRLALGVDLSISNSNRFRIFWLQVKGWSYVSVCLSVCLDGQWEADHLSRPRVGRLNISWNHDRRIGWSKSEFASGLMISIALALFRLEACMSNLLTRWRRLEDIQIQVREDRHIYKADSGFCYLPSRHVTWTYAHIAFPLPPVPLFREHLTLQVSKLCFDSQLQFCIKHPYIRSFARHICSVSSIFDVRCGWRKQRRYSPIFGQTIFSTLARISSLTPTYAYQWPFPQFSQ
jgi:hypothetical protein